MSDIDIRKIYYFGKEEDWLLLLLSITKVKKLFHGLDKTEIDKIDNEICDIKFKLRVLLPDLDPESDDVRLSRAYELFLYKRNNT